jgi:hypothetical protein
MFRLLMRHSWCADKMLQEGLASAWLDDDVRLDEGACMSGNWRS